MFINMKVRVVLMGRVIVYDRRKACLGRSFHTENHSYIKIKSTEVCALQDNWRAIRYSM